GVVAVVEEEEVVSRAVMTCRAASVFVVAVQPAECQPGKPARQIAGPEKHGTGRGERQPQSRHQECLENELGSEPNARRNAGVVSQVPVTPERLRQAEQQAQVTREQPIE